MLKSWKYGMAEFHLFVKSKLKIGEAKIIKNISIGVNINNAIFNVF